ncbi:MAG TPA: hypothetical protein DDW30_05380 [Clostridiales bacterium]|nr:hypothetical protein [Clostridiales bacterium]
MNRSRIILILCVSLLCVCLVFAITALTSLRNAIAETGQVRREAQSMLADLDVALRENQNTSAGAATDDDAQQVGVLYGHFCVRESGGQVAVYTDSGELVSLTGISVSALPKSDRDALRDGIRFTSWKEVLALLQDWGG